jgi:hypothetical protein
MDLLNSISSTGLFLNVSNIVVGVENHTNFGCATNLETSIAVLTVAFTAGNVSIVM